MKLRFVHRGVVVVTMSFGLAGAFAPAGAALAQTGVCPDTPPDDPIARRAAARTWFSRAEAAENAGKDAAAIYAYVCSMKIIPHASTAYNLARAAEKGGDLGLAVSSYRRYLALEPDARDKAEVLAQVQSLEARLAAAGREPLVPSASGAAGAAIAPSPVQPPPASAIATGDAPPAPAAPDRPSDSPSRMGVLEWTIAGAGVAALAGGVMLNLLARSEMNECRNLARSGDLVTARQRCDAAKPAAYASYALFGTALAAAAVDVLLLWRKPRALESVSISLLPGGATLSFFTPL